MSEKLCVFCKNLDMHVDQCGGDYPDPPNFSCLKRHWSVNFYGSLDDFREAILVAQDCPDYDEAKP